MPTYMRYSLLSLAPFSALRALSLLGFALWVFVQTGCTKDGTTTDNTSNTGPCIILTAPADASSDSATRPFFVWSSSCTPTSTYELQYTYEPSFTTATAIRDTIVVGTAFQLPVTATPLHAGYTYYWRVRSRYGISKGGWSAVKHFTVTSPPLPDIAGTYYASVKEHTSGVYFNTTTHQPDSYSTTQFIGNNIAIVLTHNGSPAQGYHFVETGTANACYLSPNADGSFSCSSGGGHPAEATISWFNKGIHQDSFEVHLQNCSGGPVFNGCADRIYTGKH